MPLTVPGPPQWSLWDRNASKLSEPFAPHGEQNHRKSTFLLSQELQSISLDGAPVT